MGLWLGCTLLATTCLGSPPPVITVQPSSTSVYKKDTASFAVVASSGTSLSYQWYFNGGSVSGGTDSTLTIPNVSTANAGTYYVKVTNAGGTVPSAPATLTVLDHAPVANNDSYTTAENVTLTIAAPGVLANDTDQDGDTLTAVLMTSVSHGTLTLNSTGGFTYKPVTNYYGSDSFTYKANDGTTTSSAATVSLTVTYVDRPPVASNQTVTVLENTATNLVLTATDVDSSNLVYAILARPTNGALGTLNSQSGAVTYLPATNAFGSDSFTFTAFDGSLYATGLVAVTITHVHQVPVAWMPATVTATQDIARVFSTANGNAISISAPDSGANPIELTLWATNGVATLNGTGGLAFTAGDGVADTNMTFRGSLMNLNAALSGLSFATGTHFNGNATLTIKAVDDTLTALNYDTNLAGHYTFDVTNTAATLAQNNSPTAGNNGQLNGSFQAVADPMRGNVLRLNGTNSNSYMKITGLLGQPASVTLAAWVNLTTPANGGSEVISLGESAALILDASGYLAGYFYNGNTVKIVPYSATLAGAGWHHVAYTFDTVAKYQSLYLDGAKVASQWVGGQQISYTLGSDSYIGVNALANANHFTGMLDEARIYTRALATNEIATLAGDLHLCTTNTSLLYFIPVPVALSQNLTNAMNAALPITLSTAFAVPPVTNYTVVTSPAHGTFSGTGPNLLYQPTPNYSGADSFRFVADNGSQTSDPATVFITLLAPPAITTQPQSSLVLTGQTAVFFVGADGYAPLSYQWQFNGANLAGSTLSTLTLTNVQVANAGDYTAVVTDIAGSTTSAVATLVAVVPPVITLQPTSQTLGVGTNPDGVTATFSVAATSAAPISYQWAYNGANIPLATSATLTLTNVQTNNSGTYSVVLTNLAGAVTSSPAVLVVVDLALPAVCTLSASNITARSGTLNATVTPQGSATACCFQYGLTTAYGLSSATNFLASGSTPVALSLPIASLAPGTLYHYRVTASNSGGVAFGQDATMTTLSPGPIQLTGILSSAGGNMVLSAAGTPGMTLTVICSTNLALPLSNWAVVGTTTEATPGEYRFTDPQPATNPVCYFRVFVP